MRIRIGHTELRVVIATVMFLLIFNHSSLKHASAGSAFSSAFSTAPIGYLDASSTGSISSDAGRLGYFQPVCFDNNKRSTQPHLFEQNDNTADRLPNNKGGHPLWLLLIHPFVKTDRSFAANNQDSRSFVSRFVVSFLAELPLKLTDGSPLIEIFEHQQAEVMVNRLAATTELSAAAATAAPHQ